MSQANAYASIIWRSDFSEAEQQYEAWIAQITGRPVPIRFEAQGLPQQPGGGGAGPTGGGGQATSPIATAPYVPPGGQPPPIQRAPVQPVATSPVAVVQQPSIVQPVVVPTQGPPPAGAAATITPGTAASAAVTGATAVPLPQATGQLAGQMAVARVSRNVDRFVAEEMNKLAPTYRNAIQQQMNPEELRSYAQSLNRPGYRAAVTADVREQRQAEQALVQQQRQVQQMNQRLEAIPFQARDPIMSRTAQRMQELGEPAIPAQRGAIAEYLRDVRAERTEYQGFRSERRAATGIRRRELESLEPETQIRSARAYAIIPGRHFGGGLSPEEAQRARETEQAVAAYTPPAELVRKQEAPLRAATGDLVRAITDNAAAQDFAARQTTRSNADIANANRDLFHQTVRDQRLLEHRSQRLEREATARAAGEAQNFQYGLEGLPEGDQLSRVRGRMREIGGPPRGGGGRGKPPGPPLPPGPDDPYREEFESLQKQERRLEEQGGPQAGRLFMRVLAFAAIHEGVSAFRRSREYAISTALAGGDQRQQYEAQMKFREEMATGIIGSVVSYLQDPTGAREAAARIPLAAADVTDLRTQAMRQGGELTQSLRAQTGLAGTAGYQQQRLEFEEAHRQRNLIIQEQERGRAEIDSQAVKALQARHTAERTTNTIPFFGAFGVPLYQVFGETPPPTAAQEDEVRKLQKEQSDVRNRISGEQRQLSQDILLRQHGRLLQVSGYQAADFNIAAGQARALLQGVPEGRAALEAQKAKNAEAEQRARDEEEPFWTQYARQRANRLQEQADEERFNRLYKARDISLRGTARSEFLAAQNKPFEAGVAGLQADVAAAVVAAPPDEKSRVFWAGAAKVAHYVADFYRSFRVETVRTAGGENVTRAIEGGQRFGAVLAGIEAQRQTALAGLPGGIVGQLFRPLVNQQFDQQARQATAEHQIDVDLEMLGAINERNALRRHLARDPYGEQLERVTSPYDVKQASLTDESETELRAQTLRNERLAVLALRQDYLDSFRQAGVDPRLIDVTNPRDVENPEAALQETNAKLDEIYQTLVNIDHGINDDDGGP